MKSCTIDPDSGTINFSFQYDNDPKMLGIANTLNVYFDWSAGLSTDYMTGITEVSINGKLLTDPTLTVSQKREAIDDWFNAYRGSLLHTYLHSLAYGPYSGTTPTVITRLATVNNYGTDPGYGALPSDGVTGTARLNPIPLTLSANADIGQGTGSVSATFSDADYILGIRSSEWNLQCQPSIIPYIPKASVISSWARDGHYIIFNPGGLRRARWNATVSMEGATDYPINIATFNLLEQRIRNFNNLGGTDIIKEEDNVNKVFATSTEARSSFSYSLRQGNIWSISQQIYPPLGRSASAYTASAVTSAASAFLTNRIDIQNQIYGGSVEFNNSLAQE